MADSLRSSRKAGSRDGAWHESPAHSIFCELPHDSCPCSVCSWWAVRNSTQHLIPFLPRVCAQQKPSARTTQRTSSAASMEVTESGIIKYVEALLLQKPLASRQELVPDPSPVPILDSGTFFTLEIRRAGKETRKHATSRGQLPQGEERTFCSGPMGKHRNWPRYNKERKMGRNHTVAYRKRRQTPYDHFP